MHVTFEFTPDDYARLNQAYVKCDPDTQRRKRISTWGPSALYLVTGAIWLALRDVVFATLCAVAVVVWLSLYPWYWSYCTRKRMQKVILDAQETGYCGAHEVTIDAAGIVNVTPRSKVEVKWSGIKKVTATDVGILIHTSSSTAIMVPNSAFTATNTRERFLEEMMRYREQAAGLSIAL